MSRRKRARRDGSSPQIPMAAPGLAAGPMNEPVSGPSAETGATERPSPIALDLGIESPDPGRHGRRARKEHHAAAPVPAQSGAEPQLRASIPEPDAVSASPAPVQLLGLPDVAISEAIVIETGSPGPIDSPSTVLPSAPRPVATQSARFGTRIAALRTEKGYTVEDVSRRLRVPASVVSDIEAERFQSLGPPVYARGYVRSYARLVGMPDAAVAPILVELEAAPALMPALPNPTRTSMPSRLATPALYALLTVLLVVPAAVQVYQRSLAPSVGDPANSTTAVETGGAATVESAPGAAPVAGNPSPGPAQAPDPGYGFEETTPPSEASTAGSAPATAKPAPPVAQPVAQVGGAPVPAPPVAARPEPLAASLAPLSSGAQRIPGTVQRVWLKLSQSSWVELTGTDGSRIEYAMLPAGTVREYQISGKALLRIGNVTGADLRVDGRSVDLASYARANVARVSLGEADTPAPAL